ncbi:hypothetical protein JM949_17130 [Micromonospora sp. STR1s_6]|uniref:Uncharacterized protein n=1 Tax=Micromonospora tarensis TaxID=2806100 RepID=A0ABS1YHV6_9ACTN|nr:hypothetical protein [Micromonospora tarensis]
MAGPAGVAGVAGMAGPAGVAGAAGPAGVAARAGPAGVAGAVGAGCGSTSGSGVAFFAVALFRGVAARLAGLAARLLGFGVTGVTSAAFLVAVLRTVRALGARLGGSSPAVGSAWPPLGGVGWSSLVSLPGGSGCSALASPPGGGCSALGSLVVAPGVRVACRGSWRSGSGGWKSTGGAALARRGRWDAAAAAGGAAVSADCSAAVGACPAAIGPCPAGTGGVKVARGERRRARSAGSRRGDSLGGCSCISMKRSPDHDAAQRENTGADDPGGRTPEVVLLPVGADLYPRARWSEDHQGRLRLVWSMAPHC